MILNLLLSLFLLGEVPDTNKIQVNKGPNLELKLNHGDLLAGKVSLGVGVRYQKYAIQALYRHDFFNYFVVLFYDVRNFGNHMNFNNGDYFHLRFDRSTHLFDKIFPKPVPTSINVQLGYGNTYFTKKNEFAVNYLTRIEIWEVEFNVEFREVINKKWSFMALGGIGAYGFYLDRDYSRINKLRFAPTYTITFGFTYTIFGKPY